MSSNPESDHVAGDMLEFFQALGPEERETLTEALRDPHTYIASSMDDVLAILQSLKDD